MKVKININEKEAIDKIKNSMRTYLNRMLHVAANDIQSDIKQIIAPLIRDSDTYQSLISGDLRAELGLAFPEERMAAIILILEQSLMININPISFSGDTLTGGLTIKLIHADFSDILNSAAASYQSKSFVVTWLDWLLTQGDSVILANYQVRKAISAEERSISRSGVEIMEKGSGWRVPPEYSGTIEDNFITRIFTSQEAQKIISNIVIKNIKKRV